MRRSRKRNQMNNCCNIPVLSTRATCRGFTLIEMMIVVAVIGILTAIAYPSYVGYIQKSRRADAKNALLDLAARQERFFSINNTFADLATLGYTGVSSGAVAVNSSGTSYYSLSVSVTAATSTALPTFTATATPTGSQTNDTTCYAYRLNQLGTQTNLNSAGTAITATAANNCW